MASEEESAELIVYEAGVPVLARFCPGPRQRVALQLQLARVGRTLLKVQQGPGGWRIRSMEGHLKRCENCLGRGRTKVSLSFTIKRWLPCAACKGEGWFPTDPPWAIFRHSGRVGALWQIKFLGPEAEARATFRELQEELRQGGVRLVGPTDTLEAPALSSSSPRLRTRW